MKNYKKLEPTSSRHMANLTKQKVAFASALVPLCSCKNGAIVWVAGTVTEESTGKYECQEVKRNKLTQNGKKKSTSAVKCFLDV